MNADELITERRKTHGSFAVNAHFSQMLKAILQSESAGYATMRPEHREAIDMIALKLSRIASGQADFRDHWDDISGYAKLAADACE